MADYIINSDIYQMFLDPVLSYFGYPSWDKTYGRKTLPLNEYEIKYRENGLFHDEKFIKDEYSVYYQTYWDKEKFPVPKVDLVHVHGFADYGGRFVQVIHNYLNQGYRVHLPDLPFHGRSDGIHCEIKDLNILSNSIKVILEDIKQEYTINKLFLSGGSLGGLTVTKYGIEHPKHIDGIIAVCPSIDLGEDLVPSKPLLLIGKLMNLLIPRLILVPRMDNLAAKDPKIDEDFCNDCRTYSRGMRIACGLGVLQGTLEVRKKLAEFSLPLLIQQGDHDRVVPVSSAKVFFDEVSSKDKQVIIYPNYEHELHYALGADKVFKDSIEWINNRL
ncbi:alpha/beta-hydrolase [Neoconidiobolus thromboides FSU 785]|nr:alpha/beta-hydrolase [Neoconidiobolus thromboides FSU 785]